MKIFREKKVGANSHVFISYSSKDSKVARQIYKELEALGLNPWLSEIDTAPGANYAAVIPKVIEDSLAVVVLITKDSVKSDQVLRELHLSVGKKHLIPVNMSGRPDILKSESSWEYFLGIVQMFEHTDTKSTAEKIMQNIEETTGIKFRVEPEAPSVEVVEEQEIAIPELPAVSEQIPLDSIQVEVLQEPEAITNELSPLKKFFESRQKLVFAGIGVFVLVMAASLAIGTSQVAFTPGQTARVVENTLTSEGRWINQTLLDTGQGHFFKFESGSTAASGEYYGFFDAEGNKYPDRPVYISITVERNGRFTGILTDDNLELNGFITFDYFPKKSITAITFDNCTEKLPWIKKVESCTFYPDSN